jgi:tRNA modification GTPase
MFEDTIAAISTAWGEAGIAVVRLSGPEAVTIAEQVFEGIVPLSQTPPRYMRNGFIKDQSGNSLDKVLSVWFRAPKSYTGEDVAEIHCHGGTLIAQRCLELLLCAGARHAEPGEFTKRAFLNERIDLAQAEAVIGIIRSKSEEALRAAARTLKGELSDFVNSDYEEVLNISAKLEVGLDFPEEDIPYVENEEAFSGILAVKQSMEDLLDRCQTGLLMSEGIRVALIGRPNVGKSSLLNSFLRESRAIVTSIPGTTRDIIEEVITYRGVPLRIVDTAGIGTPSDEVEAIGVERAEKEMARAEVRLWVIDGSEKLSDDDHRLAEKIADLSHIIVINKADLPLVVTEEYMRGLLPASQVFTISAKENLGIDKIKDEIVSMVAGSGSLDAGLNATSRQISEISAALSSLSDALQALEAGLGQDIAASCLFEARSSLEKILGISWDDRLLDTVFSQFCVGK